MLKGSSRSSKPVNLTCRARLATQRRAGAALLIHGVMQSVNTGGTNPWNIFLKLACDGTGISRKRTSKQTATTSHVHPIPHPPPTTPIFKQRAHRGPEPNLVGRGGLPPCMGLRSTRQDSGPPGHSMPGLRAWPAMARPLARVKMPFGRRPNAFWQADFQ